MKKYKLPCYLLEKGYQVICDDNENKQTKINFKNSKQNQQNALQCRNYKGFLICFDFFWLKIATSTSNCNAKYFLLINHKVRRSICHLKMNKIEWVNVAAST